MSKWGLKKNYRISKESASATVMQILEYFDFDVDTHSDENKELFETAIDKIMIAVRLEKIEVDSKKGFKIIQNTENDKIEYINFGAKVKLDSAKKKTETERMYAILGSSCGLGDGVIKKLSVKDLKTAEGLAILFL